MDKTLFIQACGAGGRRLAQALQALHRDYGGALLNEGLSCVGEIEAARDLVQEALLKAWRQCSGFRGESELFPWLKSIIRHAAIDWLRRQRPEQGLSDEEGRVLPEVEQALRELRPGLAESPEGSAEAAQLRACWQACAARFARSHPETAAVLRWVIEDGLTPAEIAPLLGRSPGATREYLSQCRKKARVYFAPWYALLRESTEAGIEDEAA